ncbi:GerAB/ArcD/ProY family transporter [Cohnella endophytica]|uniref:GerAB/ArcD/ProY family transporter n=1 Tax=Cohnella endophytica TaxID=2419778 RepID=UPI001314BCA0|nr:endospore germination permease [Cohnella endophytica]
MRKHQIGVREVTSIGIIFVITKIFLPFQRSLSEAGGTAAWMIALIAAVLSPLTWWAIRGILRNATQGSTLIDATEEIWGPFLGTLLNLAYFCFFFTISFLVLREFAELLCSDILPRTPINVMLISLLLPISVVAHRGIETLGRLCWVAVGLIVGSVIIVLIGGLLTHAEPKALSPFWGTGMSNVLKTGIVKSSLFSEMLVFGFLLPRMRKSQQWGRSAWWCMAISAFTIFSTTIVYLFVFPYPTAIRLNVPMFEMSRLIIFGRWIQRLESVFLITWLISAVLKLAIGLYCSAASMSQILRLPKFQPLVFPLAILAYGFALLPGSEMTAVAWDGDLLRTYGSIFSIALPMMTWLAFIVRRGKKKQS